MPEGRHHPAVCAAEVASVVTLQGKLKLHCTQVRSHHERQRLPPSTEACSQIRLGQKLGFSCARPLRTIPHKGRCWAWLCAVSRSCGCLREQ